MKFTKKQITTIKDYFEIGLSKEDISELIDIELSDLETLIENNRSVANSKKLGIKTGNIKVIKALFKSACGYDVVDNEEFIRTDRNGNIIYKDVKKITKYVSPNMASIKFWLENKDNTNWKKDMEDLEKKMNIKISIEGKDIIVKKDE